MHPEELKTLAVQLTALSGVLQESSYQATLAVEQSASHLQQTAQGMSLQGQQMVQETTSAISAQVRDAIQSGVKQAADQCSTSLRDAAQQAVHAAAQLEAQKAALLRTLRGMAWKGSLALLAGAVLAVGAASYTVWNARQELQAIKWQQDILAAQAAGKLTQCPEGGLCVMVNSRWTRVDK
jgi:hypothetical protein